MMQQTVQAAWSAGPVLAALSLVLGTTLPAAGAPQSASSLLERLGPKRGLCVLSGTGHRTLAVDLARGSELLIYVQSPDPGDIAAVREAAAGAGFLGTRIYAERGARPRLHLADNLADTVVARDPPERPGSMARSELLRVLRPGGKLLLADTEIVKPFPDGVDDWTHPYHGPDNNPQSSDVVARAPYLTQFLAEPWYGPMPEVTVVSAGRMFKAFGHISFKRREWALTNTLLAMSSYNGTLLWKRPLESGFMIHRSTIVATPETLYLADDRSLKLIDPETGEVREELLPPAGLNAGAVWKWMSVRDGTLYALVGDEEAPAETLRGTREQAGWPWTGLGRGYARREYPWGFGRALFAMDLARGELLWSRTESEPVDSRAVCMNRTAIFLYGHGSFLASVDLATGEERWRTRDPELLEAIGSHDRAQTPAKGYSSTAYAKCGEDALYFAGPQRPRLVAVSARDGRLLWQYEKDGNFQLVLREDGLYAMGRHTSSKKFDALTGKVLAELDCFRGNCTRATGTVDSIFSRGHRHSGTLRLQIADHEPRRIAMMRPACQDGVIVAGGLLYWGPWMCDCNLSLVGVISLGPAGDFDFSQRAIGEERLESSSRRIDVAPPDASAGDWPTYRADNARSCATPARIPEAVTLRWVYRPPSPAEPTAPIAVAGSVFWAGSDGAVRAVDALTGRKRWSAHTGGQVHFPPAYWRGRVLVGSADGWIYSFEASTGELLWRFRAAPVERRIPVYGKLSSTWPVASGVLVEDGTAYAAAGIASYDGTHVYALDAATGELKWQNNTSGRIIDDQLVSGVSVQGHLLLHKERLYLAGGNVVSPAIYDARTGECGNRLTSEWLRDPRQTLAANMNSMDFVKAPRGRELFLVGDEVHAFDQLLYSPRPYQVGRYFPGHFVQAGTDDILIRGTHQRITRASAAARLKGEREIVWETRAVRNPSALALAANAVLATGSTEADGKAAGAFVLAALDRETGESLWSHPLPGSPTRWGLAVDGLGRILVTLEEGGVACFDADGGRER